MKTCTVCQQSQEYFNGSICPGCLLSRQRENYISAFNRVMDNEYQIVYFAYWKGYVKIGYTYNINRRIAGIRSQFKRSPQLLAVVRGGLILEGKLHRRFASVKHHVEWFSYTDEISAWIDKHAHRLGGLYPATRQYKFTPYFKEFNDQNFELLSKVSLETCRDFAGSEYSKYMTLEQYIITQLSNQEQAR